MSDNLNSDNDRIVDPSRWDEIAPMIGGFTLRPYADLQEDPYYALPSFYADGNTLAFQPGWDGQDGGDAIHWASPWPTVARVRDTIASLLVSSWLVQDRGDAPGFFLGDEPGSIASPWGVIPAYVIFARRPSPDDAPWENLRAVLSDVDKALANDAPMHGGFVDWRLKNAVPPRLKVEIHRNPDGAIVAVFRRRETDDVITFLWNADGSPRSGEVQEYGRCSLVDAHDAYPLCSEADLENVLACVIG